MLGDLTEPGGCDGLVATGDTVFHAAAHVRLAGPWSEFQRATIDGTHHLLRAALPQRPRRFVYVSSASVYAPGRPPRGYSAGRTPTGPSPYNFYGRAKLAAERLVQTLCTQAGCPWTIVRLGVLYGPNNRTFIRDFITMAQRGKLFVLGSGKNRIATLYIDDAVQAVVLAGEHPAAAGKIYDVAGDEPVTQRQFIGAMLTALDLPLRCRHINRHLAFLAGWLTEWRAARAGFTPRVSRTLVQLMSANQVVDASRIVAELGWHPRVSFVEGSRRMHKWYRESQAGAAGQPAVACSAPESDFPA
jgi:nucleoside-diphosphate-sugar epimerase